MQVLINWFVDSKHEKRALSLGADSIVEMMVCSLFSFSILSSMHEAGLIVG